MGTHDFEYNKVPLFAQKSWNINTSMSAAYCLYLYRRYPFLCVPYFELERQGKTVQHY